MFKMKSEEKSSVGKLSSFFHSELQLNREILINCISLVKERDVRLMYFGNFDVWMIEL